MNKIILGLLGVFCSFTLAARQSSQQPPTSGPKLYFTDNEYVSVTPPAGPDIAGTLKMNTFLTADFIYWTVRQDGMFHAVSGVGAGVPKGKVHDLDWEWDPGVKVGLGFNLPHDGWDIYAEYTWIKSSASDTTSAANLISYWSINAVPVIAISESTASWNLTFNDIQLELARNSYLSQYLKLRIHVGLEGTWIDQKYNVEQTLGLDSSVDRLSLKQDFWGVGLRAGMNTSWQFTYEWSFFGDFALAILWGQFDLDRTDSNTLVGGVRTININTGVKPYTFEPTLAITAGFRWETWFYENRYHVLFQAGWEHQLWILQNEYIKVPTETDHIGDLVLQGLTIRGRFDF